MQTLVRLLRENDLQGVVQHYLTSDEAQNLAQLGFMYQQGQKNVALLEFYQLLAGKCLDGKAIPEGLIRHINSSDSLNFFLPALQQNDNFKQTDKQQRNVLHYLFSSSDVPFNYLRGMMLFETNDSMTEALCQRDSRQLTPLEVYLSSNANLATLPAHEFTALLALIEIESKKQPVNQANFKSTVSEVKQICLSQGIKISPDKQRLVLVAIYYGQPIKQILLY